ncbi:MAG: ABC transporter permease [Clostridia bacterium]|jgi:lipopolysaccharide transport system permease protein|nr:ABC transporter permease [Clostridia bacterium]
MNNLYIRLYGLYQYRDLLKQLVVRDVKLKYRRSILGYLWSVLNPLMTMMVLVIVFSNLFRFDIPNFPVYLITGSTLFGFMSEATTMAIASITGNAALLKKTYVPKYVFTLARVTSSLVNMLFSMTAIIIVVLITKVQITPYILLAPLVIVEVYLFSLGLGIFLAAASVFFRDLQYLWGIFITMWMYLTPIFYPITIIPEKYRFWYYWLNPMTGYVSQFRDIVLHGQMPDVYSVCAGFMIAFIALLVGAYTFYRSQDNFILYI